MNTIELIEKSFDSDKLAIKLRFDNKINYDATNFTDIVIDVYDGDVLPAPLSNMTFIPA